MSNVGQAMFSVEALGEGSSRSTIHTFGFIPVRGPPECWFDLPSFQEAEFPFVPTNVWWNGSPYRRAVRIGGKKSPKTKQNKKAEFKVLWKQGSWSKKPKSDFPTLLILFVFGLKGIFKYRSVMTKATCIVWNTIQKS